MDNRRYEPLSTLYFKRTEQLIDGEQWTMDNKHYQIERSRPNSDGNRENNACQRDHHHIILGIQGFLALSASLPLLYSLGSLGEIERHTSTPP
jgi:hypothetical protein